MIQKPKHVLIVTSVPFPNGNAPANRIITYCRGFHENKCLTNVIVIKPNQFKNNDIYRPKGTFENNSYEYPGNVVVGNPNIFVRKIQYNYSVIASIFTIAFNYFFKKKSDFIIFYGNNPIFEIILIFLSKLFNVVIYKEQSENPYLSFGSFKLLPYKIIEFLYMKIIFKGYSGILAMTSPLKNLFINSGIIDKKIIIINNAVSLDKFVLLKNNNFNEDYFAYVGSLNEGKDGIITLLEALAIVKIKYPNTKLKIAGFGEDNDIKIFHEKVTELSLDYNVEYLGSLDSDSTIKLIVNASGLLSARPNSLQAEFGFPTKIIEYLATGNPVVTTVTGDLKLFLADNENVFTAPADSSEGFAYSWLKLIEDKRNAVRIGENGKLLVKNIFNPQIQTKKIIDFYNL